MSSTVSYKGSTIATVSNTTKTLTTSGKYLEDDITITDVTSSSTLQTKSKSYTPTESAQSEDVTADSGYDALEKVSVSVGAISSSYVGSGVARKSSTDLEVSGATVTAPAGYYSSSASKAVSSMTLPTSTSGSSSGTSKATVSRSTSDQYINIPTGYNSSAAYYKVSAVANGTAGTPTATKGTVSNHSVSVTPSVTNTTGYITGSTKTGTAVTVSASELVSGSETKTANGTYDVTNLASLVVNVSGGSSKNTQVVQGTTRTSSSTATAIGAELTVSKTGTYDIYYSCMRTNTSSSYTWATRLYIDGTAQGTENTTWSNNIQNTHLTSVSLTVNQKLRVYGRETRGASYYVYAPMLAIVEN